MSDKVFFDTNIWVYAFDPAEPAKKSQARELIKAYASTGSLMLSIQVLQEFYAVTTRARRLLLSPSAATAVIADLSQYPLITITSDLIQRATQRHQTQVFSFWDCLIVEAALSARCSILFSEDMQHGLVVDQKLTIQNPFVQDKT